jgi:hypothetical protein
VPGLNTQWNFFSRFRFAGVTSELTAELSVDSGLQWQVLTSRAGNGATSSSGWDQNWVQQSLTLSAYADLPVRLRLRYAYAPFTSVFLGTSDSYGVFIDDITVTQAEVLTESAGFPVAVGATNVVFHPTEGGRYVLQIRPRVGGTWFGYGPMLLVDAVPRPPAQLTLRGVAAITAQDVTIAFEVTNATSESFHLWRASQASGPYEEDPSAEFETVEPGVSYLVRVARQGPREFYRVEMQEGP